MKDEEIAGLMDAVGEIVHDFVRQAMVPIVKQLGNLNARVDTIDAREVDLELIKASVLAAIPIPRDGRDGIDGKDADLALIKEVVKVVVDAIPRPQDGKNVEAGDIWPLIKDCVASLPAAKDGKDGIGLSGAVIDRDGVLMMTLTDGTMRSLGVIVGKDGEAGKDGLGFEDLEVVDQPTTVTMRFKRGERIKEWTFAKPTLADMHRGIWKEGAYKRGDVVQRDGSPWLAMADTETRPGAEDSDWVMVAKSGRNGKDGILLAPPKSGPVKL